MRAIALIALTAALLTVSAPAGADLSRLAGRWHVEDESTKADIIFTADGRFVRFIETGGKTTAEHGTFTLDEEQAGVMHVQATGDDETIRVEYRFEDEDTLVVTVPEESPASLKRVQLPSPRKAEYQPPEAGVKIDGALYPVEIGGPEGYVDRSGKIIVAPQFESAGYFSEGLAYVQFGGKYGFIDEAGKMVIAPQFEDASPFRHGRSRVRVKGKYGFIDEAGKMVIEAKYDSAWTFGDELTGVCVEDKWGCVDRTGKVVIEIKYGKIYWFSEGLAAARLEGKYGFLDRTGKWAIEPQFADAVRFSCGRAMVREKEDGPYGYIHRSGKWIVRPEYEWATHFQEGLARVRVKLKYGYIDVSGKVVIAAEHEAAGDFSEGVAAFCKDGKYGYMDKTGKVVIQPRFSFAAEFDNGLGFVSIAGLPTWVRHSGEMVRDPRKELAWADLSQLSDSVLYGGEYDPIELPSLHGVELYLKNLRDVKGRPLVYAPTSQVIKKSWGVLVEYELADPDGNRRTLLFDLRNPEASLSGAKSPAWLFFAKPKPQTKPSAA